MLQIKIFDSLNRHRLQRGDDLVAHRRGAEDLICRGVDIGDVTGAPALVEHARHGALDPRGLLALEMGKPASITSTFMRTSWRAMKSFSSVFMLAPGDCSPSHRVASKIVILRLICSS